MAPSIVWRYFERTNGGSAKTFAFQSIIAGLVGIFVICDISERIAEVNKMRMSVKKRGAQYDNEVTQIFDDKYMLCLEDAAPTLKAFTDMYNKLTFMKFQDSFTYKTMKFQKEESLTEHIAICYGDRFIPRRYLLSNCEKNIKLANRQSSRDVFKLGPNDAYWRKNTYIPTLNFVMEIRKGRILSLADPVVTAEGSILGRMKGVDKKCLGYDWPCKPRMKPFAYSDIHFDLPDYDSTCENILMDWSCNGQIAFSFGHDVAIWQSKLEITMSFSVKSPKSLAYSPSGQYLAIGCKTSHFPVLELWDVSKMNDFTAISGKMFNKKYCEILCIEWASSGKHLVCGTLYGTIFSPTMRFLASGDSEGNIVIYNWNLCIVYLMVKSRRKLPVGFDWHPWTGVDLVISEEVPASIVLLHVPSKSIVAYFQHYSTSLVINTVSFSKLTGELLVSTSNKDRGRCSDYKVLIMSSLDRVVDTLKDGVSGARFLKWSPDGTGVATTGNETLTLWKFCPEKSNLHLKRQNGNSEKCCSESKYGSQFKKWNHLK